MESFLSFIAELLTEFVLQIVFQGGFVTLDGACNLASRVGRGIFRAILYAQLGLLCSVASLYVWPYPALGTVANPWISLLIIPLLAAVFTVNVSKYLQSAKGWSVGPSGFLYSVILSVAFASVRYMYLTKPL